MASAERAPPGAPQPARQRSASGMCRPSDTAHLSLRETPESIAGSSGNRYGAPMSDDRRTGIRVNLTLPKGLIASIDRIGRVTGTGRASLIREWLEGMDSGIQAMAHALELAQKNNLDAFTVMASTMKDAIAQGEQAQLDLGRKRRAIMRKRASK